jgi:hypothetical protein
MKISSFSCLLLVSACSLAIAADWLVIASSYDHVTMVDRESFRRDGDRSEVWVMLNHDRPVNAPGLDRSYQSQRIHMLFDCGKRLLGTAGDSAGNDAAGDGLRGVTRNGQQ